MEGHLNIEDKENLPTEVVLGVQDLTGAGNWQKFHIHG